MIIAIKKFFAQILFWLLEFLDAIFEMFQVLCGIQPVGYRTEEGEIVERSLIEIFLESSAVTKAFLLVFLVAIIVCAVSCITAIVKNIVNMKGGEPKSHLKTVGQGFGSIIITIVMAFIMVFGIWGSNEVLSQVYYATSNGTSTTLAGMVFDMSVETSYVYDYDKPIITFVQATDEQGDLLWKTDENGEFVLDGETGEKIPIYEIDPDTGKKIQTTTYPFKTDENGNYITQNGWQIKDQETQERYTIADIKFGDTTVDQVFGVHKEDTIGMEKEDKPYVNGKEPMVEMGSFNFLLAFFVTVMLLVNVVMSMIGLVKRVFDIVALFIMLPLISATIPLDDGARFKAWRETVISKVVLAYGAVISINIFMLVVPVIQNIDTANIWGDSWIMPALFKTCMLVGGGLCVNGGQQLIARVFGTSAEESRDMANSARSLLAGAATAGGLMRGVKNLAVGGTNKYGREQKGIMPLAGKMLGGATNVAGNLLGGQAYRNVAEKAVNATKNLGNKMRGFASLRGPNRANNVNTASNGGSGGIGGALQGGNTSQGTGETQSKGGLFENGLVGAAGKLAEKARSPFLPNKGNRTGSYNAKTPNVPTGPSAGGDMKTQSGTSKLAKGGLSGGKATGGAFKKKK